MTVYYINLALILFLGVPLALTKPAKWKKAAYLFVTFGWMWCLCTFRYGIGYDYQSYIDIFARVRDSDNFLSLMSEGFEPGFLMLTKIIGLISPDNAVIMYGVFAAAILFPVAWFIYKFCGDVWLSTWLFVTLTFFYTTMNFIRQSLAVSVLLLGYKFLREKKPVPYFIITLLAASFHKTALIMIPVYFLCHIKLNRKWGAFYGAATLLVYLTSEFIVNFVVKFAFKGYADTIWLTEGFAIIYLIIPACIFGACLALYPFWKNRDEYAPMLLNMMMFSAINWLFITRHFILERFSQYMYILVLVALPSAVSCLKAAPEDVAERDRLRSASKSNKIRDKEARDALAALNQKVSDGYKYYWSAVAAVILITLIYNEFGGFTGNFHDVFPYVSVFD